MRNPNNKVICKECGKLAVHEARGLCVACYARATFGRYADGREVTCSNCGTRIHKSAKNKLCKKCFESNKHANIIRKCSKCGEIKPHHSKGLCGECYRKQYNKDPNVIKRILEYLRQDRKKRPEVYRARNEKQSPQRKEWRQQYHQKKYSNPDEREKILRYQKEYKAKNLDKVTHWGHSRRARIRGLPHDLTVAEWNEIVESHNHCCHYCGNPSDNLQREHKIPVSRGGGFTKDNIVPACPTCNYRKNKMTDKEFFEFLKKYPR